MKILYVITGLSLGGAEKVVLNLAEQMYFRNHEVKITYLTDKVELLSQYKGIELVPLKLNSFKDIFNSLYRYIKLLNAFRSDVVYSHMVHANIFTCIGRLLKPVPKLISTAHSSNAGGRWKMLIYRLTYSLADVTTNVSRQVVLEFERKRAVPRNSMLPVYNGVDIKRFTVIKNIDRKEFLENLELKFDKKILLALGRLEEEKDYPNLIQAISLLKKDDICNFQLIIVGTGILKEKIETLVKLLNLSQEVKFLGRRNDIPGLMGDCLQF